jgi:hypothetical protein
MIAWKDQRSLGIDRLLGRLLGCSAGTAFLGERSSGIIIIIVIQYREHMISRYRYHVLLSLLSCYLHSYILSHPRDRRF